MEELLALSLLNDNSNGNGNDNGSSLGLNMIVGRSTTTASSRSTTSNNNTTNEDDDTATATATATRTTKSSSFGKQQQQKPEKRRRLNKFEKRRLASARAKAKKLGGGENTRVRTTTTSASASTTTSANLDDDDDGKNKTRNEKHNNKLTTNGVSTSATTLSNTHVQQEAPTTTSSSLSSSTSASASASFALPTKTKDSQKATNTSTTDKRSELEEQQQQQQNQTQQERAIYMANYHARPLELDRRADATVISSSSSSTNKNKHNKKARSSRHLFDRDTTWHDLQLHPRILQSLATYFNNDPQQGNNNNKKNEKNTTDAATSEQKEETEETVPMQRTLTTTISQLPTYIQVQTIPHILNNNNKDDNDSNCNLFVHSETGSGKTLAYMLPLIQRLVFDTTTTTTLSRQQFGTRALILCPTRELALQTYTVAEHLLLKSAHVGNGIVVPGCLTGGGGGKNNSNDDDVYMDTSGSRKSEKARLRKGLGIIIATPGRFLDHFMRTESLSLSCRTGPMQFVVLDEADRLLVDMGLGHQVQHILQRLQQQTASSSTTTVSASPNRGITWRSILVSATVTPQFQTLAKELVSGLSSEWILIQANNKNSSNRDTKKTKGLSISENKNDTTLETNHEYKDLDEDEDEDDEEDNNDNTTSTSTSVLISAPQQLKQWHVTVSAKWRLAALIGFLVQRIHRGERTVVFFSTCAAVDYYHALFTATHLTTSAIYDNTNNNDNDNTNDKSEEQDSEAEDDDNSKPNNQQNQGGIFGAAGPVFKLHGSIPHAERHSVLQQFTASASQGRSKQQQQQQRRRQAAILLATDVAARGLNLPYVDWTVQFDPPSEVSDYIHRAGRVARAGQAGQSLLFLLPTERDLLTILQQQQQKKTKKSGIDVMDNKMQALSLTDILTQAATLCPSVTKEGMDRAGWSSSNSSSRSNGSGNDVDGTTTAVTGRNNNNNNNNRSMSQKSRMGEAFCAEIQRRLEECVIQQDLQVKAQHKQEKLLQKKQNKKNKTSAPGRGGSSGSNGGAPAVGPLLDMARIAFMAHLRAYPTKEKQVRHIFSTKALHLGHVARSFALQETPKKMVVAHRKSNNSNNNSNSNLSTNRLGHKRKTRSNASSNAEDDGMLGRMEFDFESLEHTVATTSAQKAKRQKRQGISHSNMNDSHSNHSNTRKAKERLMANAARLQLNGLDAL